MFRELSNITNRDPDVEIRQTGYLNNQEQQARRSVGWSNTAPPTETRPPNPVISGGPFPNIPGGPFPASLLDPRQGGGTAGPAHAPWNRAQTPPPPDQNAPGGGYAARAKGKGNKQGFEPPQYQGFPLQQGHQQNQGQYHGQYHGAQQNQEQYQGDPLQARQYQIPMTANEAATHAGNINAAQSGGGAWS